MFFDSEKRPIQVDLGKFAEWPLQIMLRKRAREEHDNLPAITKLRPLHDTQACEAERQEPRPQEMKKKKKGTIKLKTRDTRLSWQEIHKWLKETFPGQAREKPCRCDGAQSSRRGGEGRMAAERVPRLLAGSRYACCKGMYIHVPRLATNGLFRRQSSRWAATKDYLTM